MSEHEPNIVEGGEILTPSEVAARTFGSDICEDCPLRSIDGQQELSAVAFDLANGSEPHTTLFEWEGDTTRVKDIRALGRACKLARESGDCSAQS